MNPELLIAQFNRIGNAPDAIPRLRSFILDLAVRGKLVEQDSKDEPASELYRRIQTEKAHLGRAGEMRRQAELSRVSAAEIPFTVPKNWEWVRLIDVLVKLTDGTHHSPPNLAHGDFKYITAKNIKPDGVLLEDITYVSKAVHREIYSRCNPEKGDILYIKDGATTGVVTINNLDEPFSMLSSVALLKISRSIYNRLLVEFLRSPFFYMQMRGFMKGAAITRVTLKRMAPALIPLPPLAEQHRIVAKVDELMALCDRLQEVQTQRESRRDQLTVASLQHLDNGADAEAFRKHASFYLAHLPRFTARLSHLQLLRDAILNLAVRGQLLPQNPNDEPLVGLLSKNDRARQMIAKEDRRADADNQPLLAADDRWTIPSTWDWRALADLVLFIDYRGKTPTKTEKGVRLITAKNVRKSVINIAPEEFLSEPDYHTWMTRGLPKVGDVLFTTEAPMGNAAVVRLSERFALRE
jgi:type I restriction enzyme S subunit